MPPMGGASLGNAHGKISIDIADLQRMQAAVRGVADTIARQLGQVDASAKKTQSAFAGLHKTIGGLRGELTGLSIASGILTGLGVKTAAGFQESAIKLAGMTGGIDKAQALMDDLRKKAQAAGLPFADMLATAERLLPTFQGNTKELERWYNLVRRTAVLNQTEGMTGAAFSINEAIVSGGSDMVSLVERFNISRVKIRAALAENGGDFADALDKVLTSMGITDETAKRMGQTFNASFRAARDAAMQLLAEGFTPLLNTLTPILQGTAQWLAQLRETNPALVGISAGLLTITTVGAPTLLLFNQLVEAGQKLKALGILGGLGRAGGVGLAVGAGLAVGTGTANAIGRATGNDQLANATISDAMSRLWQVIRALLANISFVFGEVQRIIKVGLVEALRYLVSAIIKAATSLGGVVSYIGAMLPGAMGGNALSKIGADLTGGGAGLQATSNKAFDSLIANINKNIRAQELSALKFFMPENFVGKSTTDSGFSGGGGASGNPNAERNKIIFQWAKDVERIERDASKARIDAVRDYNRSVAQTIAQYNKSALREEEDFQRGRARAIADYNRNIADLQADAAKREATWQRDYNEKIAELRSDGNERLQELEADYAKNRERAQRDHRDRLMDAAARLDAVGVRNEMRNYKRQQEDAQDAYEEQRAKTREDLTERIADEEEAHQRRLSDAREADAERLDDMRQAFEEQQAQEDYERAIRLQRQADDHAEQLAEMAIAQAERMQQIEEQAALEKQALNDHMIEQLNALGIHRDAWLKLQKDQQDAALKQFQDFWTQFNQMFPNDRGPAQNQPYAAFPGNQGQFPSSFADFGYGASQVPTSDILRSGGRIAAQGGSSINISEGAIVVNASAGMDEDALARAVERRMVKLLQEAAQ